MSTEELRAVPVANSSGYHPEASCGSKTAGLSTQAPLRTTSVPLRVNENRHKPPLKTQQHKQTVHHD